MKSIRTHLLTAGLLATFGLSAFAQAPAAPAAGAPQSYAQRDDRGTPDAARMQEMRQLRMERRLSALKLKLQLSDAQEGAWNAWSNAMKPTQRQRLDRNELERMTTPERIDRMRTQRATRSAEMERRGEATKGFYAALNADQKKVFDGESMRMMQRGGGKRGGHHGGHHRG